MSTIERNQKEETINYLEKIDEVISLLELLSDNAFAKVKIRFCESNSFFMYGETLQSSISTLESVAFCLKELHISDAGVLIRKFRDDLIQYLFIIETMELTKGLTDKELNNYFDKGIEGIIKGVEELNRIHRSGERKIKRDKAVDSWYDNSLGNLCGKKYRHEFFDTSKYICYLRKNTQIETLFKDYIEQCWFLSNRKLNNYVHSNGREYIFRNIPQYTRNEHEIYINQITDLIVDITSMFLSIYILIDPACIQSSDFIDYMDAGMQPPEDSQYLVAGIATYFINKYVNKIHPELKLYLKKENKYGMIIE